MEEPNPNPPATVPPQPEALTPVRKGMPVVIALIAIIALIGIANISSLFTGRKRTAPPSGLPMRPASANAQQVSSFETQQQIEARHDADDLKRQQEIAAEMQQLQAAEAVPGPEAAGTPPMTAAQRSAIYGDSPNAPQQTSNISQAQAEAKQKELEREKLHQDALEQRYGRHRLCTRSGGAWLKESAAVLGERQELASKETTDVAGGASATGGVKPDPSRQLPAFVWTAAQGCRNDRPHGKLRLRQLRGAVIPGLRGNGP